MLALVKSLMSGDAAKDRFDNLDDAVSELETGCTLTFGAMPQEALNGARARIGEVSTYRFGADRYLSYRLEIEGVKPLSLIVAEAEGERYLAISRQLDEEEQDKLFGAQSLDAVVEKPSIHQLRCRENTEGFKGWTVGTYRKQMEAMEGMLSPGDASAAPSAPKGERFRYCLMTSPGHDHAIELEKYADGRLKTYATVYRRSEDIVHVAVPLKARSASARKGGKPRPWLSETGGMDMLIDTIRQSRLRAEKEASALDLPRSAEILQHPAAYEPDHAAHKDALLECDARVAVRVIEEAMLNKMPIAEVVRRVLGLPIVMREKIFFLMPLSDLDYQVLASRYGLAAADRVGIRYRIVKELGHFAGEP